MNKVYFQDNPHRHCEVVNEKIGFKTNISKNTKPVSSLFRKASVFPKLTFDIPKLDEQLHFLTLNNKLCIRGVYTQKLIERICVRAQLSSSYGGLNSKVLLIDGANSSDLYLCVDFARQYGLDVKQIFEGVITSRAFTVYQLADTIIHQLLNTVEKYGVKIIIITNLLYYFTNDLHLDVHEMKGILKKIIKVLKNIENCLVIVSLGFETQYDILFSKLFDRTIDIQKGYGVLTIHLTDNGKQTSLFLKSDELEKVMSD